jgi:hypothetical protein
LVTRMEADDAEERPEATSLPWKAIALVLGTVGAMAVLCFVVALMVGFRMAEIAPMIFAVLIILAAGIAAVCVSSGIIVRRACKVCGEEAPPIMRASWMAISSRGALPQLSERCALMVRRRITALCILLFVAGIIMKGIDASQKATKHAEGTKIEESKRGHS